MRSLRSKTELCIISSYVADFEALVFTETWLSPDVLDNELFCDSFCVLRHDRDCMATGRSRGGGVLIAVNTQYSVIPIDVSNIAGVSPLINIVACKCIVSFKTLTLVAIYISPDLQLPLLEECFNRLEDISRSGNVVIVGDFNIPHLIKHSPDDNKSRVCLDFLAVTGLQQRNNIPNFNKRYLDLIFTNTSSDVTRLTDPLFPEDPHHPTLKIAIHNEAKTRSTSFPLNSDNRHYNFKRAPLYDLYIAMSNIDWVNELSRISDVNQAVSCLYNHLYSLLDSYVPYRKTRSNKFPVWFTVSIIRNIKRKEKVHSKYRKYGQLQYLTEYTQLRSLIKTDIRQAYRSYLNKIDHNIQQDPNEFWKFINTKRKGSRLPRTMSVLDEDTSNPQTIVNAFASYFAASYTTSDPDYPTYCMDEQCSNQKFTIDTVTLAEVKNAIKSLKGTLTAGQDQIPAFLIKDCSFYLAPAILSIVNLILVKSTFPNVWKVAKITPVWKNGSKSDIKNYRPVALLSNFSKIFEIIIQKRLGTTMASNISAH